ncbi:hypothetical protein [Afifella marina]|uniref:Uncharacterized protein n=1 Tax=Afifella marina DSM 2698 TaxID=1120955 RepID=A0A1G5N9I5_AFIMA|nr:hypothetical protein [Afifella marina]SCZ34063.1 hypothetical protein SAMN03080610_01629 [Afifella marina DSM 2698]
MTGWIRAFFSDRSGNVFTMIFAATALMGVLGVSMMNLVIGPATTVTKVTHQNMAENDLLMNANLVGQAIRQQANGGDLDFDRFVEPVAIVNCAGAPSGGGCLPQTIGATQADPWGTPYGYCAWDHGDTTGSDGRLIGTATTSGPLIAVLSAGADKIFETSCHAYNEAGVDPEDINTIIGPKASGGGDDRVRMFTYEAAASSSRIGELPDEACTENTTGLMRYDMETLQICNGEEWSEVSGDSFTATGTFEPVTDASLSTQYTSNTIAFDGFLGERTATVTGGATILVNGIAQGEMASISAGDTISLRAYSASTPENVSSFVLSVSAISRQWSITTRDRTPPELTITPESKSDMNVTGPGDPAYGDAMVFIVRNTGEKSTSALSAAMLDNLTNFEFTGDGDACQGVVLGYDDVCVLEVRPKASGTGSFTGHLSTSASGPIAVTTISGNASGWACDLPWGSTLSDGQNVTAYQTASVPFGSNCVSETRSCTGGELSGSYTHQTCNAEAPSNCTLPWGGTISHGSSVTAYQSPTVPFGNNCVSQIRTCSNGTLSGSYSNSSCTVAPGASCTLPWGGTISHGSGVTAYQYADQSCGNTQTRGCFDGTLSGTYMNQSCTAVGTCPNSNFYNENFSQAEAMTAGGPGCRAYCGSSMCATCNGGHTQPWDTTCTRHDHLGTGWTAYCWCYEK